VRQIQEEVKSEGILAFSIHRESLNCAHIAYH
jgi:hypothetical protein